MKKKLLIPIMLLLMMILSATALADVQILYSTKDNLPIHAEKGNDGEVIAYLKGGEGGILEEISDSGNWAKIVFESPYGGQDVGWVKMKYMSYTMPSSFCNHNWTEWTVYQQPTCTTPGMRTRSCPICGVGQAEEIAPLSHNYTDWTTISYPTCTSTGERMRRCQTCGHEEHEIIDRLPHSFGEWTVIKSPTCTSEGMQTHRCLKCGAEENVTIARLPHSFGGWTILKEATCTEEGLESHTCLGCGYEERVTIAKLPHDFEWKIIEQATDHSAGIRAHVCKVCGYQEDSVSYDPEGTLRRGDRSEEVRELQQLLADQNYLSADGADGIFGGGTEAAIMKFQSEQDLTPDGIAWPQTIARLHHNFGEWETVKEMTRSTAGERVRKCKDCPYEQHEIIEPQPTLERGRRADDVRTIQQMINSLGYNAGTDDGIYGQMLDNAFTEFAKANNLTFEPGKITAEGIDTLANKWIAAQPAEAWMGVCKLDSPVNLALTVNPKEDDAKDAEAAENAGTEKENGGSSLRTYTWNVTNMGEQDCIFTAILLQFGDNPDFKENNYVVVLNNTWLQANCANSASGSFTVSKDWGEGPMNFTALAISESTGQKWLSNLNTFQTEQPEQQAEQAQPESETQEPATKANTQTEQNAPSATTRH